MNTLTAMSGWKWIKRGFQIFRKQPAEMLTLFFVYMFFNMGIGLIPFIGQFLPLLLVPVFALNFMQACRQIEAGERVYPNLLLTGFRSPALPNLLKLGVLYIVAAALAIAVSSLFDGGANTHIGHAATQTARHNSINVLVSRIRKIFQQCGSLHNLPRLAVTALWHLK